MTGFSLMGELTLQCSYHMPEWTILYLPTSVSFQRVFVCLRECDKSIGMGSLSMVTPVSMCSSQPSKVPIRDVIGSLSLPLSFSSLYLFSSLSRIGNRKRQEKKETASVLPLPSAHFLWDALLSVHDYRTFSWSNKCKIFKWECLTLPQPWIIEKPGG